MKLITLAFAAALCPLYSQSVLVSAIDGFSGRFLDSTGAALPFGSLVRVGAFDLSGNNLEIIQTSSDFQTIDALFTPLAESQSGSGTVEQENNTGDTLVVNDFLGTGNTIGQISGISETVVPPMTSLFFWIINSSDAQTGTEWAIAGSTSTSFNMPQAPATTTLTAQDANTILRGMKDGDDLLLGAITVVPEPSTAFLASIGLALLAGRRTRA